MQGDQKSGSQNPDEGNEPRSDENPEPTFQEIVSHIQPTLSCESDLCPKSTHEHPAEWYVKFECGGDSLWCNVRFTHYFQEAMYLGGTWCRGCGKRVPLTNWNQLNLRIS